REPPALDEVDDDSSERGGFALRSGSSISCRDHGAATPRTLRSRRQDRRLADLPADGKRAGCRARQQAPRFQIVDPAYARFPARIRQRVDRMRCSQPVRKGLPALRPAVSRTGSSVPHQICGAVRPAMKPFWISAPLSIRVLGPDDVSLLERMSMTL